MAAGERATRQLTASLPAGIQPLETLNDFGRGQTSLGYLSALPVHERKIDKRLVMDMLEDSARSVR
jgi:EAL domain-containing protein (putative c-di-GMP-specific phosphodiesterase class I)